MGRAAQWEQDSSSRICFSSLSSVRGMFNVLILFLPVFFFGGGGVGWGFEAESFLILGEGSRKLLKGGRIHMPNNSWWVHLLLAPSGSRFESVSPCWCWLLWSVSLYPEALPRIHCTWKQVLLNTLQPLIFTKQDFSHTVATKNTPLSPTHITSLSLFVSIFYTDQFLCLFPVNTSPHPTHTHSLVFTYTHNDWHILPSRKSTDHSLSTVTICVMAVGRMSRPMT